LHAFLIPLLDGAVLVFAVLGVGNFMIWLLGLGNLPWYWRMTFVAILGQATVNLLVQSLLLSGESSVHRLRILGVVAIVVGSVGHLLANKTVPRTRYLGLVRTDSFLKSLLILIWLTNLAVALAPSSKIDEIYYHMIVPKRIATDGTMNFYRLPIEAAIVPQMQYQMSLSPAYALGAPEAGNTLSLAYSIVLGLFIIGFIKHVTANDSLALLAGLGAAVGAYQTVWHTTEGPASIGELAVVVAICGILWPRPLMAATKPLHYGLLVVTAASLAASTKISLLPLCTVISLLAVWRTCRGEKDFRSTWMRTGIVLLPWVPMHLPLMLWTFHESGSFWGPVMANVLHPSAFPASMLGILDQMRVINQRGLLTNLRFASVELSPLLFVGIVFVLWKALRGGHRAVLILSLLIFQGVLILWLLPYDFRFLGGLIYVPLIAAVLMLASPSAEPSQPASLTALGKRLAGLRNWIALIAVVPWLIFQIYYARPFLEVALGIMTRNQFRERYIALTKDYEVLDRILPRGAILYVANGRVSLFDAPRPVVLTLLDLRQRAPIYRLSLKDLPQNEILGATSELHCDQIVYSDTNAVVEAYRLPGRPPKIGAVTVRSCKIQETTPRSPVSLE
jgi:hypothetical protein